MEDKKPYELIIKKNGETIIQEKTNAIFGVINLENSALRLWFEKEISAVDLIRLLDVLQKYIIDKALEEDTKLQALWYLQKFLKIADKMGVTK